MINSFDPSSGRFLGTLLDNNGNPIVIGDLWALTNGNGGPGVDPNAVYFTAGLEEESHGLFGNLAAAVPEPGSLALLATSWLGFIWFRMRRRPIVS
jgi:hypothetical protein